ncbi:aldehyde dehydrogenase family protein [Pseudomonas sp. FP597]|uniref:Aldehyde dehydrogenase family protein n=1 Tax=Pseudomonas lactucae TaxID=2813360 RepID=A0A9X0YD73_9PSED|nr:MULTISPECIES: aldehyde dehydrogenase family protein [Pseudomonas]MBN2977190.1 aldehyde dehydrogenase family protein [Pseudomonas lactucae]MBN2989466.1 aldehyde dehydrogenase family protein [Pseudomonas lactucae]WLI08787.1 aldehyde dehydrogenase family protein [Pseudomonas sp. FP597]
MDYEGAIHLDKFYIDGAWVAPLSGGQQHNVINPANGEVSGTILFGDELDAECAIKAAHKAFATYSQTSLDERIALLERIANVYERRLPEMADAITKEMGAPFYSLSMPAQATIGLLHFRVTAALAKQHPFETLVSTARIVKEPVGVCALITPWNWPMNQVVCKVAPALVAGCTIVLKPSQNAPYSSQLLAEIMEEAGTPAGVFNMILGEGGRLGHILSSHPLIDMISLTGSTNAGIQVSKAAAETIKRVSLELGGKSANIILEGADLETAVTHGVTLMMSNSGQSCTAPSRMLVPRHHLERVEAIATKVCGELIVGNPMDQKTTVGPIANRRQFLKVREMIEQGINDGARLVCGGADSLAGLEKGFYVKPTVLTVEDNKSFIAQEEIFGPVLVIIPYDSEEDAVTIANNSIYGLSGYVYGSDKADAERVARRLRTGMVHLNGANVDPTAPFGGYKQSGNGREWGGAGIEEFLETKSIFLG